MVPHTLLKAFLASLSYLLYLLACIFYSHIASHDPTDDTHHWSIFYRPRIRIASTLYSKSQWLHHVALKFLPWGSFLNDHRLSEKVRNVCAIARAHHFSQLWVDTSCLDKTSSSELSEAINSMYLWYRDAAVCYVYLPDVPSCSNHTRRGSAFRHCQWFTRGWTLQELIAPSSVVFLSREWEIIGTKESLSETIADITGIDQDVLMHRKQPCDISVAARMSWVAERSTARIEDQAYCLLGMFGIVMNPIYGEGMNAFRRLQEEILVRIPDDSIFAWESHVFATPETSDPQLDLLSSNPEVSSSSFVNRPMLNHSHRIHATISYAYSTLQLHSLLICRRTTWSQHPIVFSLTYAIWMKCNMMIL